MIALDLRSDLKRLTDQEIADRLEAALGELEAMGSRAVPHFFDGTPGGRGPVRHVRAYRALGALSQVDGPLPLMLVLIPLVMFSRTLTQFLFGKDRPRAYLLSCEVQDLQDEIARRLKQRSR